MRDPCHLRYQVERLDWAISDCCTTGSHISRKVGRCQDFSEMRKNGTKFIYHPKSWSNCTISATPERLDLKELGLKL
eukprot:scaffold8715_cov72-Attheya_sp.AAC.1